MPPGYDSLQLPCLSLMSLQTNTCSRTQFDREEKINSSLTGPWNIVFFRCKDSRSCLFSVTCSGCCSSSCQTSEDNFKDQELDSAKKLDTYEIHSHACPHILASVYLVHPIEAQRVLCGWEAQAPQLCVIDLVSLKALRLQRTWNWIAACSPSGILITLCQYCSNPPDKLEGLKQTTPYQNKCISEW